MFGVRQMGEVSNGLYTVYGSSVSPPSLEITVRAPCTPDAPLGADGLPSRRLRIGPIFASRWMGKRGNCIQDLKLSGRETIYRGLRSILFIVDRFNIAVPLVVIVQHDQYSHNVQDQPRDQMLNMVLLSLTCCLHVARHAFVSPAR